MNKLQKFEYLTILLAIGIGAFFGGHYFGKRGYDYELQVNPPKVEFINKRPADQTVDFNQFWDVYNSLNSKYLLTPLDSQKLVNGAIKGMVQAAGDPFTSYFDPKDNKEFGNSLNGVYEGIGAELGYDKDNQLIIISPIDGSPAKEAGILPGDKIIKINDISTVGMTLGDAVSKIRGAGGTNVKLTIFRSGIQPFDLELTRRKITLNSVTWKDLGNGTAYFRISKFGSETNSQWDIAAKEANIKMKEFDSIIVDVRGNPGGLLTSAAHIAGDFFENKPVIYFEDKFGTQESLDTTRKAMFPNQNVVVLIDEGSASASEILAGALKVHKNAVLVGKKSFGKGSIQEPVEFPDGGSLHVTVQKWLLPDKTWIHQKGINPDVEVSVDFDKLKNEKIDTQLEKAKEVANSKM
jgi:carboxyl-terminal processing protease